MWRWTPRRYSYWLIVIPTVALCLGANLVVLAVANALWFKPRGVADIDQLVVVMRELDGLDSYSSTELGVAGAAEIIGATSAAAQTQTTRWNHIQRLNLWHPLNRGNLEVAGVSSNYFDVLGVRVIGLDLPETAVGLPSAIISDHLWETAFGRGPVAGRRLQGPKHAVTIAGVAAPGFRGARLGEQVDVWIDLDSGLFKPVGRLPVAVFGIFRLPPHSTAAEAQRRMAQHPRAHQRNVVPLAEIYGSADDRMVAFSGDGLLKMAGLLSLVIFVCGSATLTVAVLMMLEHRRKEFAIRWSLGANRSTLLRSLVFELGAMLGVSLIAAATLATWILRAIPSVSFGRGVAVQRLDLAFDARLGVVSFLALFAMALLAMAGPVWRATGASSRGLSSSSAGTDRRGPRHQEILLSIQVGAALICVVIAVQFVRTVHGFRSVTGFDTAEVVFVEGRTRQPAADPAASDYDATNAKESARVGAASQRFIERVLATPGVTEWAVGKRTLGPVAARDFTISRAVRTTDGEISVRLGIDSVGPGFLQVLGLTARSGMLPASREDTLGGRAVVVTSSLARQLWGDEQRAVGNELTLYERSYTVVGVVETWYGAIQYGVAPAVFIFDNWLLAGGFDLAVAFRTRDAAHAKRAIADALLQEFPEDRMEVVTGTELVARDLEREQIGSWLFTGYGAIACVLALGGVLALVSYMLRTTRREIGIRVALGASRIALVRHCAALGGRPVAIGAIAGALLSPLFTSAAQSSFADLVEVGTLPPFIAAACVAAAAAIIAAWQSRRVISTPPQDLLRD